MLWFAFVLWIIFDWYQLHRLQRTHHYSCDLLSFFELSLIDTNKIGLIFFTIFVVICFRSLNYLWLIPTLFRTLDVPWMLWFAFVLWIIFDWYQPANWTAGRIISCDLLVLWIIFDWYQRWNGPAMGGGVVICFRSLNYLWLIPTKKIYTFTFSTLWFAFVLWIIFDWYQPYKWA